MTESFLAKAKAFKQTKEQGERPLRVVTADAFDSPARTGGGSGKGYAEAALDKEADNVRSAPSGTRNHALNAAAFSLGQLVAGGELNEQHVITTLAHAARSAGLDEKEIGPTIASGLAKGQLNPRVAPRDQILRGVFATPEQAAERWEDPEPLEGDLEPAPPFPANTLPGVVGDFVTALAAHTQTPVDLGAMMVLSGLSVAAANRAWIDGGSGWNESLIFWSVSALPPGSRKSPVVNHVAGVFYRMEADARRVYDEAHRGKEDLLEAAQARRAATITSLGKATLAERNNLEADLEKVRGEIEDLTVPPAREYLISDFTPEALAVELAANDGTIGVLDDEGGVFGNITGRYTQGTPQLDLILTAYDGKRPYKQSRVGRRKIEIPWPAIAIGLAVQPSVLRDTTTTPALRERGLMGRFAYCVPQDTVGTRTNRNVPDMPHHLTQGWGDAIEAIARIPICGPDQPRRIIPLAYEAHAAHLDYRDEIEPRLHPDTGDLAFMADWAAKHAGRVLRIAGLLHLAGGNDPAEPVSLRTMTDAITIGDWMIEHAVRVYGGWRAPGVDMTGPLAILKWIRRTGTKTFTVRDFHVAAKGQSWVNADVIRDALVVLVEAGWLASVEEFYSDGKRRRKDGRFVSHPALLGGSK